MRALRIFLFAAVCTTFVSQSMAATKFPPSPQVSLEGFGTDYAVAKPSSPLLQASTSFYLPSRDFSEPLKPIKELPDEEDERRLSRLLEKDLGDLLSDTFADQQLFFHNLAFINGVYYSDFWEHEQFRKLLNEIDECKDEEKPNYNLWELFLNLSAFFLNVSNYGEVYKDEFYQLGKAYQEIAETFGDASED